MNRLGVRTEAKQEDVVANRLTYPFCYCEECIRKLLGEGGEDCTVLVKNSAPYHHRASEEPDSRLLNGYGRMGSRIRAGKVARTRICTAADAWKALMELWKDFAGNEWFTDGKS